MLVFCLQRSIEDKLTNLKKEKKIIKNEINRITPEVHKVTYGSISLFSGIL